MTALLPNTQIEIRNEVERGRIRHALFDFDGTISLLREGWETVMAPLMLESICGGKRPTPEIEDEVRRVIDETTGVQTIVQMEKLAEMVRARGLVPHEDVLDAWGYKERYNKRLMKKVNDRIARLKDGDLTLEEVTVRGSVEFLRRLRDEGVVLYVFSGTDREDVRNEAETLGVADYFAEIWGAVGSLEEYSKEMVLREIIQSHGLHGTEVFICGDGPVEIRNAKQHGCITLGVASDEVRGYGWNPRKRERLLRAGADVMVPDFTEAAALVGYLFPDRV